MKKVKVGFQKGNRVKIRGGLDTIYIITARDKWLIKLEYTRLDGTTRFAGWADVSLLIQA